MLLLVLTSLAAALASTAGDAVSSQLATFRASTSGPIGILTTLNGAPVQERYTSPRATLNKNPLRNEYFIDTMTHLLSERIPERLLHVKGVGAKGYFEVTHDVTDITKAAFLNAIGKKTKLAARFSGSALKKGGSDLSYNIIGFALKFYTEEGNFDLPTVNVPIFGTRDPGTLYSLLHATEFNPVTNVADTTMTLDAVHLYPTFLYTLLRSLTPVGLPLSLRHMATYNIHTLQLANSASETYFSRFYITPDLGVQNLTVGSTTDPNYLGRDLYNAIANGSHPSWTVWMQPLSMEDINNAAANGTDLFDVTREISTDTYPLRQVGKIILNENPTNYFADVEQIAFNLGNLVPGIVGGPDKVFEGRRFFYRTTQIHRLGINYYKIEANRPIAPVYSYNRDGVPPVLDNGGSGPNYYPNSFNGPVPVADHQPALVDIVEFGDGNLDQAAAFYAQLSEDDLAVTVSNFAGLFTDVPEDVTNKTFALIRSAPDPLPDLADRIAAALNITLS